MCVPILYTHAHARHMCTHARVRAHRHTHTYKLHTVIQVNKTFKRLKRKCTTKMTCVFVSQRERGERYITTDRDGIRGSRARCRNTSKRRMCGRRGLRRRRSLNSDIIYNKTTCLIEFIQRVQVRGDKC